MEKLKLYFKLMRINNAIIAFMATYFAGIIGGNFKFDLKLLSLSISAALIGSAGNIVNDILDYEIDKINRPDRPLLKGKISKKRAEGLYFVLNILGIIFSLAGGLKTFLIANLSIGVIFLYSLKLKSIPLVGNFAVAFMTGLTFVYGSIATDNLHNIWLPALFALYVNFIRELVKDIEDVEGDSAFGLKTYPIVKGTKNASKLSIILIISLILLDLSPYFWKKYNYIYFFIIIFGVNSVLIYTIILLKNFENKKNISKASLILKLIMPLGLIAIWLGA